MHVSVCFRVEPLPAVSADVCIFKNICFRIRSEVKIDIFIYFSLNAWFEYSLREKRGCFTFYPQLDVQQP